MTRISGSFQSVDDKDNHEVSYEEILQIRRNRHDYERFGDADTY